MKPTLLLVLAALVATPAAAAPTDRQAETAEPVLSDKAIEYAIGEAMPLPVVSIMVKDIGGGKERFSVNMSTSSVAGLGDRGVHVNFEIQKKAPRSLMLQAIKGAAAYARGILANARKSK